MSIIILKRNGFGFKVGAGVAAKWGILFKDGLVIERCRKIDTMCFDKTGTLTTGTFQVTDIVLLSSLVKHERRKCKQNLNTSKILKESDLLTLAASLELASEHPIAEAIVKKAREQNCPLKEPKDTKISPGCGISGNVCGKQVAVGNLRMMDELNIPKSSIRRY
jgi:Cu+-exporting ATPase